MGLLGLGHAAELLAAGSVGGWVCPGHVPVGLGQLDLVVIKIADAISTEKAGMYSLAFALPLAVLLSLLYILRWGGGLFWNGIDIYAGREFFIPFYLLRVQAEEKMMLDTFGDQYRGYMQKVGGVIPK